ncbi:Methylenetetrahydrofolate reductase 1 [Hondaea fermentalgiana]|uniref:Methylenetetrahydrofolate reductase 1 n=1 Tax=Hondaea fermentalgiana TaxID=2315210 RepID=A0A2R5GQZ1_9STRA|nr:Methylenetetrahydrofolate reductase 1 [Hondaea fermentalgiana]|eukprot:GBG32729.1 Methylenetetrahydrofolate reductase 1 [Hondaea fermentalgiana]
MTSGSRLIERMKARIADGEVFHSFEYFPPAKESGRKSLQVRVDRMADMSPLFVDVTARAGNLEDTLRLCSDIIRFCGVDVMMHVTSAGLARADLVDLLQRALEAGITNVLALGGDPAGKTLRPSGDFAHALDMVRAIREDFGDAFTIAVGCYPEGLGPLSSNESWTENRARHIGYLKEKVLAGADFAITQAVFDASLFVNFVRDCHQAGVSADFPILPGIMPIHNYKGLKSIVSDLNVSLPETFESALAPIQNDTGAVMSKGIELIGDLCAELLSSDVTAGLHFYTFNLEYAVRQLVEKRLALDAKQVLPWRQSANPRRLEEDVRPIFWANRPKSYLMRTEGWDQFPSGRWGSGQPGENFAMLPDSEPMFSRETFFQRQDIMRKAWGEAPQTEQEIFEVFAGFLEGRVPFLPWCEESLHLETSQIRDKLVALNRAGYLTINSQPRVNAAPSSSPDFGWGPGGGYVYQKAYIEFFTSPRHLRRLMDLLESPEFSGRSLVYHAVDHRGNTYSNDKQAKPCAVTWGVFPGKEVIQPTVVDPDTFLVWKDEAFGLWVRGWASIYEEDSSSYNLLYDMHDGYFLVNIVDNDFIDGDIFDLFDRLVAGREHGGHEETYHGYEYDQTSGNLTHYQLEDWASASQADVQGNESSTTHYYENNSFYPEQNRHYSEQDAQAFLRSSSSSSNNNNNNNNNNIDDDSASVATHEAYGYDAYSVASSYYDSQGGELGHGYDAVPSSSASAYGGDYYEHKMAENGYSGYESATVYAHTPSHMGYSSRTDMSSRSAPPPPYYNDQHGSSIHSSYYDQGYAEYYRREQERQRLLQAQQEEALQSSSEVPNIFSLTRHNRYDDVEALFDAGIAVDTRDALGNTVLCIACQNGLKRIAKLALRRGANINAQNYRGNSPLHFCYMYQYGDTLGAYLLSKGADPMLVNSDGRRSHELE